MEADERMPGRRHECGEPSEELDRLHHAVGLLAPRLAQRVGDAPVRQEMEALEAQGCSRAVAKEALPTLAVVGGDAHSGVDVEAA